MKLSSTQFAIILAVGIASSARADFLIQSDSINNTRMGNASNSVITDSYGDSGNGSSQATVDSAMASATSSVTTTETATTIGVFSAFSSSVSNGDTAGGGNSNTQANGTIYFQVTDSGIFDVTGGAVLSVTPGSAPFSPTAPGIDFEQFLEIYDIDHDQDVYSSFGYRTYTGGTGDVTPPPPTVSLMAGTNYLLRVVNYGISNTNGAPSSLVGGGTASLQLTVRPVPEPSSIALIGLGGLGSLLAARRMRARSPRNS